MAARGNIYMGEHIEQINCNKYSQNKKKTISIDMICYIESYTRQPRILLQLVFSRRHIKYITILCMIMKTSSCCG